MSLSALAALLAQPSGVVDPSLPLRAEALWADSGAAERTEAAALALHWGFPSLALRALGEAGEGSPLWAAACLRRGDFGVVLARDMPQTARWRVLHARAAWMAGDAGALAQAHAARLQARTEGDAPALTAAATLCGELELQNDPKMALRSLAEGLKVAEVVGEEADAHLLAVLAYAQRRAGGEAKAQRTAEKALSRAQPRSPARVLALRLLGQTEPARAEAEAGELSGVWWQALDP